MPVDGASPDTERHCSTIGVVASDPEVRDRLISVLHGPVGNVVCRDDVGALAQACSDQACNAAVLHLSAPQASDAVRAMRAAAEALDGVPLVVVSAGIDSWLRRLLRAGAMGFVREDQVERALAPTVGAVLAGQTAIPLTLAHHVRESSLSHRERQILELVALGFTNTEIAARCFLAESTIKTHLSAAFRKLGVHSRKDAAALILDPDGGFATSLRGIAAGDGGRAEHHRP